MTEHNYFFPDFLGKMMAKVDLRTQYEASLLSMSLIAVGLVLTIFYLVVYFEFALWYKILLVINGLAGLLFFSSGIITTFQQYQSYMVVIEFQKIQETINQNQSGKGGKDK